MRHLGASLALLAVAPALAAAQPPAAPPITAPEPASLPLIAAGLVALGVAIRKRGRGA